MLRSHQTLRVFLSHSSGDKPSVRDLYKRLRGDGFAPWLDEEDLLPGQDWNREIAKAIRNSDAVIVCLSKASINKSRFVQREIKSILDIADEQPEDTIFLIPLKLEECDIPERLRRWHWVNFFEERGYEGLLRALNQRDAALKKVSPKPPRPFPPEPKGKVPEQVYRQDTGVRQRLEAFQSASPIASWIFGSALLIFLFIAVFFLPSPAQFQKDTIRFLMALAAAFFSLFFIGGVLLKGTLKGLFISATGGFVLFILLQFVFDPFKPVNANLMNAVTTLSPSPLNNPAPSSTATPQLTSSGLADDNTAKSSPSPTATAGSSKQSV